MITEIAIFQYKPGHRGGGGNTRGGAQPKLDMHICTEGRGWKSQMDKPKHRPESGMIIELLYPTLISEYTHPPTDDYLQGAK